MSEIPRVSSPNQIWAAHTFTMARPVGRRHRSQPAVGSSTPEPTPTPRDLSINQHGYRCEPPPTTNAVHQHLQADLEKQLHRVFRARVDLGVTALAAVAGGLRDGQARHPPCQQRCPHPVEFERL